MGTGPHVYLVRGQGVGSRVRCQGSGSVWRATWATDAGGPAGPAGPEAPPHAVHVTTVGQVCTSPEKIGLDPNRPGSWAPGGLGRSGHVRELELQTAEVKASPVEGVGGGFRGGVSPRTHAVFPKNSNGLYYGMPKNRPVALLFLQACNSKATWANTLGMESFLQAFGYDTPFLQTEKKYQRKLNPKFAQNLQYIRKWTLAHPLLGCGLLDERFGVAPPEWPSQIREAWKLEQIPTPYEMACAMLHAPSQRFWCSLESSNPIALSMLYWYLAGMPSRAIAEIFGVTPQTVYNRIASLITWAMGTPRFALWSLSTDLIPVATNIQRARAAAALWRGESMTKWLSDPKEAHEILQSMADSPYIRAQLARGRAYQPIPRPIYSPGFVWSTLEAKREWESSGSISARWLMRWRMYLREALHEDVPTWVRIPQRCPIYSVNDREVINVRRQRKQQRRLGASRAGNSGA